MRGAVTGLWAETGIARGVVTQLYAAATRAAAGVATGLWATTQATLRLVAVSGQTFDSFDTVTLSATVADLSMPEPDEWMWAQTGGPTVTLAGTGATRTFTAPGRASATVYTFQVSATAGSLVAPAVTVTVNVRAHGGLWALTAGRTLVAAVISRNVTQA